MSNQSENKSENTRETTTSETTSESGGCWSAFKGLLILGGLVIVLVAMCSNGEDDNKLEFKATGDARRDSLERIRVDLFNRELSDDKLEELMKMSRPVVYRRLANVRRRLTEFPRYWPWNGRSATRVVTRKGDVFIATYDIRYPIKYVEIGVGVEMDMDVVVAFDHNTETGSWTLTKILFVEE